MTFNEHAKTFAGLPVVEYEIGQKLKNPEKRAFRLRVEYGSETSLSEMLTAFLEDPGADRVPALVIGMWADEMYEESSAAVVEALAVAAPQLPSLKGIFLGDIVFTENEVSWTHQSDVSPLWTAYPQLEYFTVRGGNDLSLGKLEHDYLKSLAIETGGLPKSVLKEIAKSRLPELEHLEIYLGTSNYGWDGTIDDVKPLLEGDLFPKLRYLGLRNSEIADEIAKEIVKSPLLERIETLDLSLGTLTDKGGELLAKSPAIARLKKLDLHHHYLSDEMAKRLKSLPVEVDVGDPQTPHRYGDDEEEYRYVAIGE